MSIPFAFCGTWLLVHSLAMATVQASNFSRSRGAHRDHIMRHAVCITGLQRSYPEISHNIHYSLSNLYGGWRSGGGSMLSLGDTLAPITSRPYESSLDESFPRARRAASERAGWSLAKAVGFFGVRPANDSWAVVRTDLPPLLAESIQTPCGPTRPAWFSAYAKTHAQKITYGHSFVQMLCDMQECHRMIQEHEQRLGRQFLTLARLRLDLAWETPLVMPTVMHLNAVYVSRMNTKAGVNDKWAIGRRAPMGAYLGRVKFIETANRLFNRTGRPVTLRAAGNHDGFLKYDCPVGAHGAFACQPGRTAGTEWQFSSTAKRRFIFTSEGFLQWALWRSNVSIAYEPSWMFCKFGNSINTTARICVPRMRKALSCGSLICQGGLTDCFCKNTTCASSAWYCQDVRGKQLQLDPYSSSNSQY